MENSAFVVPMAKVMSTFTCGALLVATAFWALDSSEKTPIPTQKIAVTHPSELYVAPIAEPIFDEERSQFTAISLGDGTWQGTSSQRLARSALSLSKLYIADYVLSHGTLIERGMVEPMIRESNDDMATILFQRYPESIAEIAKKYHLYSTKPAEHWGYSQTSSFDVAYFLYQLIRNNPQSPILEWMRTIAPAAADGTEQNFGTALLNGVEGSKLAWSNDHTLFSSASFGDGYVVVAMVQGDADDLNHYVQAQRGSAIAEPPQRN
ncbi:putative secreted protein [Corynebacterium kutscheri]|uniref:Secreted protein n=1 Tax=Corynebacterium kutscheri TaxID=35755 RepID=A0A0F6R2W8_9CORY|nr:hypothetical protein [Corynebacterium kutscheri]AKE41878.1 hypothetical protein UL82_08610 [Corynebacterium kutscheri]VEH04405.1 putative secreted protein [Corynebacterium kutscheri]VEH10206.1 putative secreted protein [Corynebacterium kutscheri]VEH80288.1 putative secreted protein [Corynebacterium kutscheri]